MKEEKIKVLALLPMELPKEIELDNTLEAMQNFVGGLIECITWQLSFLFAQSVSGLIASFLFKIQRWNFLHQILHVAIQRTRKAKQRFCLCFVDVLLSLFVLLDGTHRHISLSCQFRLAQSGQCAHGFQVCFRL